MVIYGSLGEERGRETFAVQCWGEGMNPFHRAHVAQDVQSFNKECHLTGWVLRLDLEAYQVDISAMSKAVPVLKEVMALKSEVGSKMEVC